MIASSSTWLAVCMCLFVYMRAPTSMVLPSFMATPLTVVALTDVGATCTAFYRVLDAVRTSARVDDTIEGGTRQSASAGQRQEWLRRAKLCNRKQQPVATLIVMADTWRPGQRCNIIRRQAGTTSHLLRVKLFDRPRFLSSSVLSATMWLRLTRHLFGCRTRSVLLRFKPQLLSDWPNTVQKLSAHSLALVICVALALRPQPERWQLEFAFRTVA